MSPSQTKDEADDAVKQRGILGIAVFTVKQPPLQMKIYLTLPGWRCLQVRSCLAAFIDILIHSLTLGCNERWPNLNTTAFFTGFEHCWKYLDNTQLTQENKQQRSGPF